MKKGFMIVVISAALMMFSACTRQMQELVSGQSRNQITVELKRQEYPGIAEIKNGDSARQSAIFERLGKTGRDTCGFLFTETMKEMYLAEAMKDDSVEDEPYYTYYDEEGNPKFEIYFDKSGVGCGVCYDAYEYEHSGEPKGFVFREYYETAWEEENPALWYEPREYFKDVESCKTGEYSEIRNYEEQYEYNDDGLITGFFAKGETDLFTNEWIPVNIASYTCEYHENGSKKKEELFRHSLLFGTFMSTAECRYDETGRIVYIRSYITHGSLEYFFIYEDDGDIPAYGVVIDHYPGMDDGVLYRYVR